MVAAMEALIIISRGLTRTITISNIKGIKGAPIIKGDNPRIIITIKVTQEEALQDMRKQKMANTELYMILHSTTPKLKRR